MKAHTRKRTNGARGSVALEFLLVLPIFLLILVGTFELVTLMVVEQKLILASYAGANAARHGGNKRDVEHAVDAVLISHGLCRLREIELTSRPSYSHNGHGNGNGYGHGNGNGHGHEPVHHVDCPENEPPLSLICVRVKICPACSVVPNYLRCVGYDLREVCLEGHTVMPKE